MKQFHRWIALFTMLVLLTGMLVPVAQAEELYSLEESRSETEDGIVILPEDTGEEWTENRETDTAAGEWEENPETDVDGEDRNGSTENNTDSEEVSPEQEDSLPSPSEGEEQPEGELAEEEQVEEAGENALAETEEPAEETGSASELDILEETSVCLQYDDYYNLEELYNGYCVLRINTTEVTSYQVSGGAVQLLPDTAVVRLCEESGLRLNACGIGQAEILLVPAEMRQQAEDILKDEYTGEEKLTVPAVQVNIIVEPAVLTIMYLSGQSNMMGCCSKATGYHPEDSIPCEQGQVYSTFSSCGDKAGGGVTGVSADWGSIPAANDVVAGALGGGAGKSINGELLTYPLNSLTDAGKGKTGIDSALAYEWNRLTGEKVWVVNVSKPSTSIVDWQPGGRYYNFAASVFAKAQKTFEAELNSGHYQPGYQLMFWMQGEADRDTGFSTYLDQFTNLYNSYQENLGLDEFGIISTRSNTDDYTNTTDLTMTAPRLVQYIVSASKSYYNVYLVSDVNEKWVSDAEVADYFFSEYPGGILSYPRRSDAKTYSIPTSVAEVHADNHFSQIGHNETGLDAARSMYAVVNGMQYGSPEVNWLRTGSGIPLSAGLTTINGQSVPTAVLQATLGSAFSLMVKTEPAYMSKAVLLEYDTNNISFDERHSAFTVNNGNAVILAKDYYGNILSAVQVEVAVNTSAPKLKSAVNNDSGIRVTWSGGGGTEYYIYRKTASTGWKRIAIVPGSTLYYDDCKAENGVKYVYTVRAYASGKLSDYDKTGITCIRLCAPELSPTSSDNKGIRIKWSNVPNSESYALYRKTENGTWKRIATISQNTYADSNVQDGVLYFYTVRAIVGGQMGPFDRNGVSGMHTSAPVLSNLQQTANGLKISWSSCVGAEEYVVYRKTGNGSWKSVAVTEALYYSDSNDGGVTYTYTVRARRAGNLISGYDSKGKTATYLSQPVLVSATGNTDKITVKWNAVSGAETYKVYRRTVGGSWKLLGSGTSLSYTDKTIQVGVAYDYTVRAVCGSSLGAYDQSGLRAVCPKTPELLSASSTSEGILVTWDTVSDADHYRVFRKSGESSWSCVTTVEGDCWTDKNVKSGQTYTYTVRAMAGGSISGYNKSGVTVTHAA